MTEIKISKTEKKLRHYITKAIADYKLIEKGDKVMLCLSGGKDSFGLLKVLNGLIEDKTYDIDLHVYTLDQSQPGWDDSQLRKYLDNLGVSYEIETKNTYGVVIDKVPEGKTYCSLCSRLRRGNIYRYAKEHKMDKIILGHHRDDLIESLLMSILYQGQIKSMPPKFITQDGENTVIRPMVLVQERDLIEFAKEENFPIIPCNLCGSQENLKRKKVKKLIQDLAHENPKVPSNILNSLSNVLPSHLMDRDLLNVIQN
ncbi:tRNA 2-thiocytidine(32) synthetase TtcA [Francisella philomiragia]|uniref:tRNA 2-thiocytidine(32) synthetase TtcA n=1 Tax=Francisella philomiragia TaxID=28110 RepID=UPI0019072C80|nr:tRNA 2-thiocytidine(32) synthetase TtcA [Francisella philomiragia]MBK2093423.1 tRNA 2-thiocytidine(32) synthetase TtcA [Francisella philomiragia]MBK2255893.1 tRNA 2-thiocytidine(32) synthetase TtcA [Francisella philomiragia]MBK2268551.1 tRNA 2-thiocytidine(32) synthetase TtcA [Francisella philomiragia]MBK2270974.1 tRNA 2-thiocytidine(32) synthetase TtcA [Francisella philomiragia]MBK2274754.1 tRNA 2-thiocytidine(32) synthetase TtcA [Francisella philomiragia]